MKKIFTAMILLSSITTFSQNLEVIGGINNNRFYDFRQDEGHFSSSYNSDYGYTIRIALDDIKADQLRLRFTLSYDQYGGEFRISDGGLGGGYTTAAKIDKSVISVGLFPLSFKVINKIDLNFGVEFGVLVSENINGTSSGWNMGRPYWSYDLNDRYDRYSSRTYFGLRGRIAYDFNISDKLSILPQYSYYLGVWNEFDEFPKLTKSMRHYFCIGLQKKLK